ncbi:probable galacturonosyltransferase 15 isoform X2 [Mercurialis annua]|uniref:probable galacturonosyltransferase 15 isoform X2 n=1 Tax=Mercurialis annua TaxID=3986 RepID=UPI00215FF0C8|nr:probable galacturonosyltransferase 15 isoform X2 [Mercurialis annua]
MKFYISTTGIKRLNIPGGGGGGGKGSAANRRISGRTLLPVLLVLAIVLPFLFVRIAFLVLESATACNSSLDCIGWRFLGGSDTSLLREELTRALLEAKEGGINNDERMDDSTESFNELVKEMTSKRQDIKSFAFRTKAMLSKMEHKMRLARQRESIYWHLASHGIPKSLHCLCLKLSEEYAVNAIARSRLPSPEYVSRLADPSFHHVVLLTDNVLAASVVISSTVQNSVSPEKLVFHIITDKKTYTPMHAWFSINPINSAVVEIKGLHQYDWSKDVNVGVKEMLEIHHLIWSHYYTNMKEEVFQHEGKLKGTLQALNPSSLSLLNHLRIYLPELFPDLNKIVFLDDDVVVQRDISFLWELDLDEKVVGAVIDGWCGENCCPGRRYKDYLNFSHPIISSNLDPDQCAWLYGMNVFDLSSWRKANITTSYRKWLEQSLRSGLDLWQPGALPPALLAFNGQVHPIDHSWHLAGLGHRTPDARREILENAAVLHFSGPAKPWLEIGSAEVQSLWNKHVNLSNEFIKKCRIMG